MAREKVIHDVYWITSEETMCGDLLLENTLVSTWRIKVMHHKESLMISEKPTCMYCLVAHRLFLMHQGMRFSGTDNQLVIEENLGFLYDTVLKALLDQAEGTF